MRTENKWLCSNCGTTNDLEYEICYNCGAVRHGIKAEKMTHKKGSKSLLLLISCVVILAALILTGIFILFPAEKTHNDIASDSNSNEINPQSLPNNESEGQLKKNGDKATGNWDNIAQIYTGMGFSLGLREDGTVVFKGQMADYNGDITDVESELSSWENITKLAVGVGFVLGLQEDGTVLVAGENESQEMKDDVAEWKDIIDISAGSVHALGVSSSGKVYAAGHDDFGEDWQVDDKKDITKAIAVTCSAGHMTIFLSRDGEASDSIGWTASGISDISSSGWLTLGIKEDGTVTGTGEDYSYLNGDLSRWTDIVQVLAGDVSAAGLKSDGTVVVAGGIEMDGEKFPIFSESQEWTDIKLLRSDGEKVLIGIKNDGTVAAAKRDEDTGDYYFDYDLDACLKEIGTWTDIVDVSVAYDHIVGLKSDGTVVAVGNNDYQQCELY